MSISAMTVISLGVEIVQIGVQVYNAVKKVLPEVEVLYSEWTVLASAFMQGTEITEDQVHDLRAKITALSEANAKLEDAIINGTAA